MVLDGTGWDTHGNQEIRARNNLNALFQA